MSKYLAKPYEYWPPDKVSYILRSLASHENMFNDYQRGCDDLCFDCTRCKARLVQVASTLASPRAAVWEVWPLDVSENGRPIGILYLTDIVPGTDALSHFNFFDGKLRGKASIMESVIEQHVFGKLDLHRITTTVPEHAHAMGKWLERHLGFSREGTKREAMLWHDEWEDLHIYGRVREAT